jgi:hypothetical protein
MFLRQSINLWQGTLARQEQCHPAMDVGSSISGRDYGIKWFGLCQAG